jgi:hypothetical protein
VLTEAAVRGKVDELNGLKENVIMGRLIPAWQRSQDQVASSLFARVDELGRRRWKAGQSETGKQLLGLGHRLPVFCFSLPSFGPFLFLLFFVGSDRVGAKSLHDHWAVG